MADDYRRISVLVHGWWGAGKSWFAASCPGPRLVLDTEGGFHDTPGDHVLWSPTDSLPTGLTKDSSVIVDVQNWGTLEDTRAVLREKHPFKSVIIDSLHELQDQLKREVAEPGEVYNPNATFQMQAWGRLLNNMGLFLRELRDFTRPGTLSPVNVVLVCGTDDEKVPAKPLLEGKARQIITGFYDVVGYLTEAKDSKQNDIRVLSISPSPLHVAKCRLHNLKVKHGSEIINPDFRKMLAVVNPKEGK